jgi:elongation factor Tu
MNKVDMVDDELLELLKWKSEIYCLSMNMMEITVQLFKVSALGGLNNDAAWVPKFLN